MNATVVTLVVLLVLVGIVAQVVVWGTLVSLRDTALSSIERCAKLEKRSDDMVALRHEACDERNKALDDVREWRKKYEALLKRRTAQVSNTGKVA